MDNVINLKFLNEINLRPSDKINKAFCQVEGGFHEFEPVEFFQIFDGKITIASRKAVDSDLLIFTDHLTGAAISKPKSKEDFIKTFENKIGFYKYLGGILNQIHINISPAYHKNEKITNTVEGK